MPAVYFEASFGGVSMHVGSINTTRGRDIAIQSPTSGDNHSLTDRGKKVVSSTWEILFVDRPNLAPYLERYEQFRNLVESGEVQILSHKLDGTYPARAADLQVSSDSNRLDVRCTCTFHQESRAPAVLPVEAGTSSYAGTESVTAHASSMKAVLADLGLASSAPADAEAAVARWEEGETDSNDVLLEVTTVTQKIDSAIAELELATDLDRWEAYRAMVELRYAIVRAGEAFTSAAATVFTVFIDKARPVRVLVAEALGVDDLEENVATTIAMNRLRTPARVPAGTSLLLPRRSA